MYRKDKARDADIKKESHVALRPQIFKALHTANGAPAAGFDLLHARDRSANPEINVRWLPFGENVRT